MDRGKMMRTKFEENTERGCDKNLGITENGRLILISPTCLGQPRTLSHRPGCYQSYSELLSISSLRLVSKGYKTRGR